MKVFLSSTFADLDRHREVLIDTLLRMSPDVEVLSMEHFGSRPSPPVELSVSKVRQADVYVGIFGWRYGTVDKQSNMSITEVEYRTALATGIPVLLYFASEEYEVKPSAVEVGEGATRIQDLKRELSESHTTQWFTTPEDLARRVATDLHALLADPVADAGSQHKEPTGPVGPEVNPAHPFILCHLAEPSWTEGCYEVSVCVDLYHEKCTQEYKDCVSSVDRVVYQLHETFPIPIIPMQNWRENWMLRLHVYGEFWVKATVYFKLKNRTPLVLIRYVNLPDDCLEKRMSRAKEPHD